MTGEHNTEDPQYPPEGAISVQRQLVGIGGLVVAAVVIGVGGGLRGAVIAGLVLGLGMVTPAPIAFGIGVAGLLATESVALPAAAVAGVGLGAVFIEQVHETAERAQLLTRVVVTGGVLSVGTAVLLANWSVQAVVIAVAGSVAVGIYVIHRYERVTLGLVAPQQ